MLILVSGGSASGKSEFAEGLVTGSGVPRRLYAATMRVLDGESVRRVERHRALRAGKGFETVELPFAAPVPDLPEGCAVLLEDLTNLFANEWFGPGGEAGAAARVRGCLDALAGRAALTVVVANELTADGVDYDPVTAEHLTALADLNRRVAERADAVYEVVCGIPICWKEAKV